MIKLEQLQYGFAWGVAKVERLFSDQRDSVTIGIDTPKVKLQIRITKIGKVRIHSEDGREWKPEGKT